MSNVISLTTVKNEDTTLRDHLAWLIKYIKKEHDAKRINEAERVTFLISVSQDEGDLIFTYKVGDNSYCNYFELAGILDTCKVLLQTAVTDTLSWEEVPPDEDI